MLNNLKSLGKKAKNALKNKIDTKKKIKF